ncbi:UDP-N-acetylmuramyl pentapeptide phosphotransferase/UDP-N-acetylglucosamine-1-phosphate transferase [Pseudomonas sp. GM79]|uniref:MraY family glycosyltransferase n=1 Tax=Pseudomonas sp. GM79 TaxID=1144338 RepID=UPI00026F7C14|nr:glycosyltransferase family 4 protein [Pseudomonas sp. GM79]EJN23468.1 UDP-N-acetylmuramyl pentapeptide phosphotransferase/UDP-N-acetylglucosamine-1-phosphate transferase [Pseudomonas sp. GM79]
MTFWWALLAVFVASWFLTLLLRRYALAKSLIDIPNARSSHSVPTPRGGGVAIVVSFVGALLILTGLDMMSSAELYALLGSGLLVAIIGFADDHGHIAARWRLLGHFIAAAWALSWLNGLAPLVFFGSTINLGWFGNILAAIYLVWMLNLYNFMDGIDGLASAEAICACVGAAMIYWLAGHAAIVWVPLMLAGAVAGFFYWNFPPAKIFMGDAGSGFLGLILAVLSLSAAWVAPQMFWVWVIMLGAFIVDATWTLLRRLIRGDAVSQAHRSHAYQYASRLFKSHKKVTVAIVAINLIWLWPIGLLVGLQRLEPLLGVLLAYLPLIGAACLFKAGSLELAADD